MGGRRKPGQRYPSDRIRPRPRRPSDLLRKDRPSDLVRRAAVQARRDARQCLRCGGFSRAPGGHQTLTQCTNWLAFDAQRQKKSVEASRVTAILFQRVSPT